MDQSSELFDKTEEMLKAWSGQVGLATQRAIDRNDAWGEIAKYARDEGHEELADRLESAESEWEG